jgi:hypothetical protein
MILFGCAPGWKASDTKAATNAALASKSLEAMCSGGASGVANPDCLPSRVRALERMSYCANASMLQRHGQPIPDAGIACEAK